MKTKIEQILPFLIKEMEERELKRKLMRMEIEKIIKEIRGDKK